MAQKNIVGQVFGRVVAEEIAQDPAARKIVIGAGIAVAVIGGVVIVYAGYKVYKWTQGVGKTLSSALNPAKSAWEGRPKIIFKGLEQGGVIMAGTGDLQILGGLVQ